MFISKIIKIFTLICLCIPNLSIADAIDNSIKQMSLDQKVGQLFIVGFPQQQVDKRLSDFVIKLKPGSFIFFKRNVSNLSQIKNLTKDLQKLSLASSGMIPFIAVDQEGGLVSRLPIYPPMPNALALGQTRSPELAEQYGFEVGQILKGLGFNMNLAPVLDIADPLQPSMIGVRSYGFQPELVGSIGYSIAIGLSRASVVPTAKHFPGMGTNPLDPHYTLVSQNKEFDVLLNYDVKAFERFASLPEASAVMMSHLIYPALDPSKTPALFSTAIINDILRTRLGFSGIVITDDLMMSGSSLYKNPEDGAVLALKSGVDMVMLTWSFQEQERAFRKVKAAILSKDISEEELNKKLRRILIAKNKIAKAFGSELTTKILANKYITTDRIAKLEQSVLDSNLHEQKDKLAALRLSNNLCIYSSNSSFLQSLKSAAQNKKFQFFILHANTQPKQLESNIQKKSCEQTLIAVHGTKVAQMVNNLTQQTKKKVILLSLISPSWITSPENFSAVINLYFNHLNVGNKVAQILQSSDRLPSGK